MATKKSASPSKKPASKPAPSTRAHWQKIGLRKGDTLHTVMLPDDYDASLLESPQHTVKSGLPKGKLGEHDVVIAFTEDQKAVVTLAAKLGRLLGEDDHRIWIAYPRGGKTDINRDRGWETIRALGLEGVTLVSLGDRWSAMRYRPIAFTSRRA